MMAKAQRDLAKLCMHGSMSLFRLIIILFLDFFVDLIVLSTFQGGDFSHLSNDHTEREVEV